MLNQTSFIICSSEKIRITFLRQTIVLSKVCIGMTTFVFTFVVNLTFLPHCYHTISYLPNRSQKWMIRTFEKLIIIFFIMVQLYYSHTHNCMLSAYFVHAMVWMMHELEFEIISCYYREWLFNYKTIYCACKYWIAY